MSEDEKAETIEQPEVPRKPPAGYQQVDWLTAKVELPGFGVVTLADPPRKIRDEWAAYMERRDPGKDPETRTEQSVRLMSSFVQSWDGYDGAPSKMDFASWDAAMKTIPAKVIDRLDACVAFFLSDQGPEGN